MQIFHIKDALDWMSKATAFGGIVGRGGGGVCGKVGYALFLLSCSGLCSSIGKPAHKKKSITFLITVLHMQIWQQVSLG